MKITEKFRYDADPAAVYGLITDETFRSESCRYQGSREFDVSIDDAGDGGGANVTVVRTMPAEGPDFVKKITGDEVRVKQFEDWSGPDSDGRRTADVSVKVVGQPAEMKGTVTLAPDGDGSSFVLEGDVKVSLPVLGKKIEPEFAKAIASSLRQEVEYGTTKL